jgi:hypothetical protein
MPRHRPLKINIVEEDGWKPYDPGNVKGVWQWAIDNAWDDFTNMSEDTCESLVRDLYKPGELDDAGLERICEQLKDDHAALENTAQAMMDASQWAWEEAYTPTDGDIAKAMKRIGDWIEFDDYWSLIVRPHAEAGPKDWYPGRKWTETMILEDLESRISYSRKEDAYDRYIVFDWKDAPPVVDLLAKLKRKPGEGGSPADVEADLDAWMGAYMNGFWVILSEVMQDVDTHYRVDFWPHWKSVLRDKDRMKAVAKEISGFLK